MAAFPSGEFFNYLEVFIIGPLKNRIWWGLWFSRETASPIAPHEKGEVKAIDDIFEDAFTI
jgi:hypothetical protein